MLEYQNTDPVKPHVLVVDASAEWRNFLGKALKSADISYETALNPDTAIARLEQDDQDQITAVITDAFQGQAPRVIEAANDVGAKAILLTKSSILRHSTRTKEPVFLKQHLRIDPKTVIDLLQAITPKVKVKTI